MDKQDIKISYASARDFMKKQNNTPANELAKQIHSNCNKAGGGLLLREVEEYEKLLLDNLSVIAFTEGEGTIVGSGFVTNLSENRMEGGSINVVDGYRGHKISHGIVRELLTLRNNSYPSKKILMTVKPSIPGNEGMIIAGLKNGFVPISHHNLAQEDGGATAKECCCCPSLADGICKCKDVTCVLLVEALSPLGKHGEQHIENETFLTALGNNISKEKIQSIVRDTLITVSKYPKSAYAS